MGVCGVRKVFNEVLRRTEVVFIVAGGRRRLSILTFEKLGDVYGESIEVYFNGYEGNRMSVVID